MYVVLDTLDVVTTLKWHMDMCHAHEKLYVGTYEECLVFVQREAAKQLASV